MLDRQQRGHHRLALVIGAAKEVLGIRQFFVDAVLSCAVPVNGERAHLLRHGPEWQSYTSRDDALHAIDLVLLHQFLEALDGILGVGLFLNHQLKLAPADTPTPIELLHPPLTRPDPPLPSTAALPTPPPH